MIYKAISFPEIQEYMELEWFDNEAISINDDLGVSLYGYSAYMIPINRLDIDIKCDTNNIL